MGGAGPRPALALALALATVALAGARDVARTDAGAHLDGTGGFTGPRRALAQWTLPPRLAVPSPEDLRLPWQTSPRAAASAAMGSDNFAPLGEDDDDHETDGIPKTTSLTTDYDDADADYFALRAEGKLTDPLEQELARWYRTTDELEAPLPESQRVEEPERPTETDDALDEETVETDLPGDERQVPEAPHDEEKPPRKDEETYANATSFSPSTRSASETSEEGEGEKQKRSSAGERLGWLEAALAEEEEEKEEKEPETRVAKKKPPESFDDVELFYADATDPRRRKVG